MADLSGDNWLQKAAENIQMRMAQCSDGGIEFGLLGLVADPLHRLRERLAENVCLLQALESSGAAGMADSTLLRGPAPSFGVSSQTIARHAVTTATTPGADWETLTSQQAQLRREILQLQDANEADYRKANDRRHDYSNLVGTWLRLLGEKGELAKLVLEAQK